MKKRHKKNRVFTNTKPHFLLIALFLITGFQMANAAKAPISSIEESQQSKLAIAGKIVDQQNEPLIGVTVLVKGTQIATMSDVDGNFAINVPNANATLVFSYVGFINQEIALNGKTSIKVTLVEDTKLLDEVVVVGYGTLKRGDVATAITSVKPAEFNLGGTRDPLALLEGKVAGLMITRTNGMDPNSATAVQLRGVTSLTGDKSPLIVIDGIPGGNLDLIQPDDVASIEVLKDGSAAAIYGSRANAGVILITTKKGKAGATQIDYSTFITKNFLAKRPKNLTAAQYRAYKNDPDNSLSGSMTDYGESTDFYDELINRDNLTQYHNLAISGGSESATYRGSVFYNDFQGIAKENGRKSYGGTTSINAKGFDNMLTMQVNMATNYYSSNLIGRYEDDPDDSYGGFETAIAMNPTLGLHQEIEKVINPVNRLKEQTKTREQETSSVSAKIGFEPINNLIFSVFASKLRKSFTTSRYINTTSWESIQGDRDYPGFARKETKTESQFTVEPTVDYTTIIADKNSLNALAGYAYQYNDMDRHWGENRGFLNDFTHENDLGAGSGINNKKGALASEKGEDKLISFFGRINYSYDNRYVFQASIRHEGSTKFGDNHKWGNFPSYSFAWNASNEDFMKQFTYLSLLKVRAGYGVTGNSGLERYKSIVQMGTGGYYISPDGKWVQTYGPSTNPNPDLRWETKREYNLGFDFGFLNNRIGGTIDLFSRETHDLLEEYQSQQPSFILDKIYTNVGKISSKGIEIAINTIPIANKDFMWKADFIASHAINKLVSFSNQVYTLEYKEYGDIGGAGALGNAIRTYQGDKIGNFYGKRFAGFDEEGKWLFFKKDGQKVHADAIESDDLSVIGNGVPKFYLAMSHYLKYKDFDMSLTFRGKFGFQVLNRLEMAYGNKIALPSGNVLESAITKNAELNDTYQYSDYYIENGDFVKLDNLTIGYNFKNKSSKKIPNFRIYATGRDLLTITGYKGLDPEVEDTGLEPGLEKRNRYPVTRSITLGLNIQF